MPRFPLLTLAGLLAVLSFASLMTTRFAERLTALDAGPRRAQRRVVLLAVSVTMTVIVLLQILIAHAAAAAGV